MVRGSRKGKSVTAAKARKISASRVTEDSINTRQSTHLNLEDEDNEHELGGNLNYSSYVRFNDK